MKFSIFWVLWLLPFMGEAAGLSTPFSLTTTQVLPRGVRSFSLSGVNTNVDGWFNNVGMGTGVAEPFNQSLSYERLLNAENDQDLKMNVEAQLRNQDVPLTNIAGQSFADINTRVFANLPVLAYGVSDRWTLAVAVPIIYTHIDVETGFVGTEELQSLVTDFSEKSRRQTANVQQKLTDVIATELVNKGYKPLEDSEQTQVGDLILVAKYLAHKSVNYSWAITNSVTAPTAHVRDVNKIVDPTPGDGQWDWGVTSTFELPVSSQWRLLNNTGYTFQFADIRETRVPISEIERASADLDYGAHRDLGDQMFTSFAALYTPVDWVSFGAAYTAAYKERDQWSGVNYSEDRYRALGVETEQWLEALYLQASFSTVGLYRRQQFSLPGLLSLGYAQVFDGRNVRKDPLLSMNATLFF